MRTFLMVLLGMAAFGCRPALKPADCATEPPPDIPAILLDHEDVLEEENWVWGEGGLEPFVRLSTGDEMICGDLLRIEFCCLTV